MFVVIIQIKLETKGSVKAQSVTKHKIDRHWFLFSTNIIINLNKNLH